MIPTLVSSLSLCVLLASPAAADGVYVRESFGGSSVHGELAAAMDSALSAHLAGGYRRGRWAIEGFIAEDWFAGDEHGGTVDPHSLTSLGVTLKYLQPISMHWEIYLRGNASHAWLDHATDEGGRGLGAGAGIQVKGKIRVISLLLLPLLSSDWGPRLSAAKITAALFADAGADFYRLHRNDDLDDRRAIDASVNRLSIGFALGSDF